MMVEVGRLRIWPFQVRWRHSGARGHTPIAATRIRFCPRIAARSSNIPSCAFFYDAPATWVDAPTLVKVFRTLTDL